MPKRTPRPKVRPDQVTPKPYQIEAIHQLRKEGNWPKDQKPIPGWLLEKMYWDKILGGYEVRPKGRIGHQRPARNPVCPSCFVAKPNSGQCDNCS